MRPGIQVGIKDHGIKQAISLIGVEDKTFEIHSPYLTASKWWIGSLGRTVGAPLYQGFAGKWLI